MLLVAVEALRAALAAVPHLRVADRDEPILRHAPADPHLPRDSLEVLVPNGGHGLEQWLQRSIDHVVEMPLDPSHQRCDLLLDDLRRTELLAPIAPIDVEPGLDAGREQ